MFNSTAGFIRTWKPKSGGKLRVLYKPRMEVRIHPKGNITVSMVVKRQGVSWRKVIGKFADNRLDKQQIDELNDRYRKWYLWLEDKSSLPQDILDRTARAEDRAHEAASDAAIDAAQAGGPMNDVIDDYLRRHVSTLKTVGQIERMYAPREEDWTTGSSGYKDGTGGCLGALREAYVADITRPYLIELLRSIEAPTMANRARSQLMKLCGWMVENGVLDASPATNLPKNSESKRHRVLSDDEIRAIWSLLSQPLKFALCTGQRRSEISNMKWSDIQGDTWVQEDTKSGLPHSLKLPEFALSQLPERSGVFVWSTDRGPKVHESTLTHNWKDASDAIGIDTRLHDARRTVGTGIAELTGSAEAADRVLNHVLPGVTSRYVRTDFGNVKADALRKWNDRLQGMVNL
jgi:integrase